MFQLELYETENGERPVSDFLDSLDNKMAAKLIGLMEVLYFFYEGKIIIVTNGFVKKTQKTPSKEIKLAKERREDWIDRYEKNKNNKS